MALPEKVKNWRDEGHRINKLVSRKKRHAKLSAECDNHIIFVRYLLQNGGKE